MEWVRVGGQGSGSTETGVYALFGASTTESGIFMAEPEALFRLPSESEWCKAAYYDPTPGAGGGDNFWRYPTQSDGVLAVSYAFQ